MEYLFTGIARIHASLVFKEQLMNRRDTLKTLAALPLASFSGRLFAAPNAPGRLLVVFLRGGYDAANLLVPVSSQFYYEARPNIAIARPSSDNDSALPLNSDWGLHPALRNSMYPLFLNGQASFIPFAGTNDLSRSHFETQDNIELGQAQGHGHNYRSGFLNRLAATLVGKSEAIAFTDQLPLILQGAMQIPNVALRSAGKKSLDTHQSSVIASMYKGTNLAQKVTEGFAVRDEVMHEMAGEMTAANRNAVSVNGFETEAQRIAKLMKDKYHIGFIDVGGWDTHVGEGGANGYLANHLNQLGNGLASFAQEMGPDWRDTVVVVISEFGRTFRENGNRGTDHGHGTVYWVLGGGINGKRVLGEQTHVEQATLFQNRDYPVLNEYRAIFAELFSRMYGLNATQIDSIFPGASAQHLELI
jgi:uncharacterized protein (DUF1501 family)